jgi:hypothetical protein
MHPRPLAMIADARMPHETDCSAARTTFDSTLHPLCNSRLDFWIRISNPAIQDRAVRLVPDSSR